MSRALLDLCGAVLAYMASYVTTQDHANTTAQANEPTHQDLSDVPTIQNDSTLDSVNSINDDHHTTRNNGQEQGNTSNDDNTTPVHNTDVAQSAKEDNDCTEENDDHRCPFVCAWEVAHLPGGVSTEDKYLFHKEYNPDAAKEHKEAMARASAYVDKILEDEGFVRIEDLHAMRTASATQEGSDIEAKKKRHRAEDSKETNKSAKRVKFATTTTYSFPIELGECSLARWGPLGMGRRHVAQETFDLSAIAEGDPSHTQKQLPMFVAKPKNLKTPRDERIARLRAADVSDDDIHAHAQLALEIARKKTIEDDQMNETQWHRTRRIRLRRATLSTSPLPWAAGSRRQRRVGFGAAAVYTFDIDLGVSAISSDGGLPLGMSSAHSKLELFDLTRTISMDHQRVAPVSPQERERRIKSACMKPTRMTKYMDEAAAIDHSRYIDKVKRFKDNTLDLLARLSELDQRRSCGPYEPNHETRQEQKRRAPDDAAPTNAKRRKFVQTF